MALFCAMGAGRAELAGLAELARLAVFAALAELVRRGGLAELARGARWRVVGVFGIVFFRAVSEMFEFRIAG